eukprot:6717949-Pyramimonas_sp.AAC.1
MTSWPCQGGPCRVELHQQPLRSVADVREVRLQAGLRSEERVQGQVPQGAEDGPGDGGSSPAPGIGVHPDGREGRGAHEGHRGGA